MQEYLHDIEIDIYGQNVIIPKIQNTLILQDDRLNLEAIVTFVM